MRKLFASLLTAVLVLGLTVSIAAADSATISIQEARLVAKGVAVEVRFDIVCDTAYPTVQYGYVRVDQRINGHLIASGQAEEWTWGLWSNPLTCDGVTVNSFNQLVTTDNGIAFKSGVALVEVYAAMSEPFRLSLEMRLTR